MVDGPWPIGTRVVVRDTYPGRVVGHRGPGHCVELDRQIGPDKVVLCAPHDIRREKKKRKHKGPDA